MGADNHFQNVCNRTKCPLRARCVAADVRVMLSTRHRAGFYSGNFPKP